MRVRLIAAGTRLPAWIDAGVSEYGRRFGQGLKFELVEIPLAREAERMRAAIAPGDYVVALEVRGRALATPELAEWLAARMAGGRNLALLVGGPDGLDEGLSARADFRWSLSPLTWPHGLVRVMVAEQLYRAHSLLLGHPYHRA
ncbi:MAG TPA: 23S rRNA (pseudouridine(1915)-N(3))-methyltransferase RlmH [Steroidobacteraceae bacterium]|nr:23S rRNA (pseudouridine(1915)-N(3))-methyltransferase RlmH [Steroidobacteraceae bacterium]